MEAVVRTSSGALEQVAMFSSAADNGEAFIGHAVNLPTTSPYVTAKVIAYRDAVDPNLWTIDGRVLQTVANTPVPGATITFPDGLGQVVADASGAFCTAMERPL